MAISPAEFHILISLSDADRHGYAIMQQVEAESGGSIRLGPGTLYGAIKRLLASGLIKETTEGVDPKLDDSRRRYYRLTPSGRKAVTEESERLASLVRLARAKRVLAKESTVRSRS
jgi:DNA-binding PadR family transcriptional regulator